jgi:hypothetical protein
MTAPISVFDLTDAQLRPIVEAATGERVAAFDISVEHQVSAEYYGFAADKLIPTFRYVTPDGRRGRVTVFAKHSHNPDSAEPEHYRFLGQHDVPLPRLYGVLRSPKDRPVLFLEYLDMSELSRGAFTPNVRFEFLSLIARFNAVRPSPEYAVWLGQRRQREREEDTSLGGIVDMVWERAGEGGLGEELQRFCSEDTDRRERLRALAERVTAEAVDMELGLVSGDLSFENTGRRQSGERVMFDVEGIGLGPRFTDAAGLLGRPDSHWPPAPYPSREVLVEHYLHEYARWGGDAPRVDQFAAETRVLWLRGEIGSLRFGAGWGHADSRAPEEQRQASRRAVLGILEMLLEGWC